MFRRISIWRVILARLFEFFSRVSLPGEKLLEYNIAEKKNIIMHKSTYVQCYFRFGKFAFSTRTRLRECERVKCNLKRLNLLFVLWLLPYVKFWFFYYYYLYLQVRYVQHAYLTWKQNHIIGLQFAHRIKLSFHFIHVLRWDYTYSKFFFLYNIFRVFALFL